MFDAILRSSLAREEFRQVLFIVLVGVAKTQKIRLFALYQNETSRTTFAYLLAVRKL